MDILNDFVPLSCFQFEAKPVGRLLDHLGERADRAQWRLPQSHLCSSKAASRRGRNSVRIVAATTTSGFAGREPWPVHRAIHSPENSLACHPRASSSGNITHAPATCSSRRSTSPRSERECPGRQRALSGRGRAPVYQARECLIQPVHQVAHGLAGDLERTDHNPIGFRRSRGISPARSSEDVPLPEAPEMTSAVSP